MHVHIIGICGKASSAVATLFQDMGWTVTGSDQGMYPPVSDYLKLHGITVRTPYHSDNLKTPLDLVVVAGNALIVNPDNPEYIKARELGIPIKSFPEVVQEYVVKDQSLVVIGNYGKGTIAGALVHALTDMQHDPSYMVGGQILGFDKNLHAGSSEWSVVEGDEYPTPPIEKGAEKSKFFYYNPRYVILTSAEWDHYDKFPTEKSYIDNYITLVKSLPQDGLLVINADGRNCDQVIPHASCRVVTYGTTQKTDYPTTSVAISSDYLFGRLNNSNLTASYALLHSIGFEEQKIRDALQTYKGLEYRLQKVYEDNNTIVIRDLAHSPVKAQAALQAIREKWPNHFIVAVFEAFSSSLKTRNILPELSNRFADADAVLIPKVDQVQRIAKDDRITGKEITEAIGDNAIYLPKDETILEYLNELPTSSVVVFMSSGGIRGIPERYINTLSEANNTAVN